MYKTGTPIPELKSQRKHLGGFTLLEALVALLVLSLIMTAAFGALRVGGQSWEAGIAHANDSEALRSVTGFLRRQFGQLIITTWLDNTEQRIAFEGTPEQVRFIAPAPRQLGSVGLLIYTLSAQQDGLNKRLILSHAPLDPGAEGFEAAQDQERLVLVEALQDVRFSYYGKLYTDEDPAWHRHWDTDAEMFPEMVSIHFDAGQGIQPWPDLELIIRAGGAS